MMVGVALDDHHDQTGLYTLEFFLSLIGVPFKLIHNSPDNTCDLFIHYGWRIEAEGWGGRPVISIPPYSRKTEGRVVKLVHQQPPRISSFLLFGQERLPLYYPFVSFSEGKILYHYTTGEGAVVQEGDVVRFGYDIVASAFYLLNLEEEREVEKRETERRDLLQPTVDRYIKLLQGLIERCYHSQNLPCISLCHWPYGKRFAVCLSHDVDRIHRKELFTLGVDLYRILTGFLKGNFGKAFSDIRKFLGILFEKENPYWNFERWMALEGAYKVRSTFYFMEGRRIGRYGRRYNCRRLRGVIQKLHDGGWEIGLHGSYSAWRDSKQLMLERTALERTLGDQVTGHRQHYLRFDSDRSYSVYQETGFDYDTTLGYNDFIGYRAGTSFPFFPYTCGGIMEIPLVAMDHALVKQGLSSQTGFLLSLLQKTEAEEGCVSFLWHQDAFDDYHYPGWSDPRWREAYEGILRYVVDRGGWAATGRDMATWWRERNACRYTIETTGKMIVIRLLSHAPEWLRFRVLLPGREEQIIECWAGEWQIGDTQIKIIK